MHNLLLYANPMFVIYVAMFILFARIWLYRLARNGVRNTVLQAGVSTPVFDAELTRLAKLEGMMTWVILALLILSLALRNPWWHLV